MKRPVLALAIILIACGMTKSPKSFDSVPSPSHFVLEADVMVATRHLPAWQRGATRPPFRARTVYYLGEPGALLMPNARGSMAPSRCRSTRWRPPSSLHLDRGRFRTCKGHATWSSCGGRREAREGADQGIWEGSGVHRIHDDNRRGR